MRKKIGIITGSGPEAGVDLWQKILEENKLFLKDDFQGDLDAPNVTVLSVPELGHSMELEKNYNRVWETLENAIRDICKRVDYFAIACNTLNLYSNKIEKIYLKHKFISTFDVVKDYLVENSLKKVCIVGALPVIQMKEYSVFKPLIDTFNIEVPKDLKKVHELIYDVKKYGGDSHKVINDFRIIVDKVESNNIFLACTELPLIKLKYKDKNLIDVTQLLARKLVEKSF
ncbi:aspartate/glutamate racemase family protein [Arcobacter sp. LA11]|uniref:aspartate/glutamate racemase family protein n=1 Tax=Arcobacter sp. LA11 TaxID=1898176 RepID=UPI0009353992|nr:aspartate/glutamate racemase family protein [Arcobacter sp. LA11]